MEDWRASLGDRADKAIDAFVDKHTNLGFKSLNVGGKVVVLVHENDLSLNDFALVEDILKKQARVERDGIINNCFTIAVDSLDDKTSDGVLFAQNDASKVAGYANHAINYKNLADGTVLAVDYTTPSNYDVGRGIYKTFCIHAHSKEVLLKYLSELHGGEWREKTPEELAETRKHAYRPRVGR